MQATKIRKLQESLDHFKKKCKDVDRRRALENEGFVADFKACKKKMNELETRLLHYQSATCCCGQETQKALLLQQMLGDLNADPQMVKNLQTVMDLEQQLHQNQHHRDHARTPFSHKIHEPPLCSRKPNSLVSAASTKSKAVRSKKKTAAKKAGKKATSKSEDQENQSPSSSLSPTSPPSDSQQPEKGKLGAAARAFSDVPHSVFSMNMSGIKVQVHVLFVSSLIVPSQRYVSYSYTRTCYCFLPQDDLKNIAAKLSMDVRDF